MAEQLPDHIARRRAEQRERRRRRRRLGGAVAAVLAIGAAAVLVVVLVSVLGAHGARQVSGHRLRVAGLAPDQALRRGSRPDADTVPPVVRRLIALGLPVYCGGPHGRAVAFTFDDGPGVYTHYAVRKLTRAHEHATFFVVGKSIRAWPGWLHREARLGALGDHTLHHLDLLLMPPAQAYQEIAGAKRMIERDSGRRVLLFRPPYGAHDPAVDAIVRRLGMLQVMWSVDSADSLGADHSQIVANVERGLRPGAIIEMHENRGQTIRALTTLLPALRRRRLRSVSVLSLLESDPPSVAQVRRGEAACGEPAGFRGHGAE